MDEKYAQELVAARLRTLPPNIGFSFGVVNLKRDEIIEHVMQGTDIGKQFVAIELRLLLDTPKLAGRLSAKLGYKA